MKYIPKRHIPIWLHIFISIGLGILSYKILIHSNGKQPIIWERKLISSINHEIGFAYKCDHGYMWMSSHQGYSPAQIFENGVPLTPSNALHDTIRQTGKGAYSFWYNTVYFSTSDNTDPRTNRRVYEIFWPVYIPKIIRWIVYGLTCIELAIFLLLKIFPFLKIIGSVKTLWFEVTRLVKNIVIVLSVAVGLWLCVFYIAKQNKLMLKYYAIKEYSVDFFIVYHQLERLKSDLPADIIFLGDSSCLTGINPLVLSEKLGLKVESYCTTAFAGPETYAYMLDILAKIKYPPKQVILAFHPIQFTRSTSWDTWPPMIKSNFEEISNPSKVNYVPLFTRGVMNQYLIYIPV
ncbi:MAG: hypothetical protein HQK77_22020, partial [Desulfobacterales bacterium]|nr:hypothetical protein [Desulfobacterales bacterium]